MKSSSSVVFMGLALVLAACVSVTPPGDSPLPTSTPTLGITTMAPPTDPPATPTEATPSPPPETPTDAPTDTLPPPTDTAQPTDDLGFDERDLLAEDDLSDPASGWGVGDTAGGSIAYVDGALQFDTSGSSAWMWSRRTTGNVNGTMRVVGEFVPDSDGNFGLLCASGDDNLVGAVVSTGGGWSFVRIGADGAEELLGDADAGLDVSLRISSVVAVECAGTASGSLRLQLWLPAYGLLGLYESDEGPQNFDRAAVYAEGESDDFSVRLEQIFVFGVTGADGELNSDGEALLSHVPSDWHDSCYQSPVPPIYGGLARANVVCFLGAPGRVGAEVVEYAAYGSKEDMDEAYRQRVDTFGTGEGALSCAQGSGERAYTIDNVEAGRVLCVPQHVGIRFDWTDDRLNILSSLVDFDGSHSDAFEDWADGGPNV